MVPSDTSSQAAMIATFSSSVLANFSRRCRYTASDSVPDMIIQGLRSGEFGGHSFFLDEPTIPGQALLGHKTVRYCKITNARAVSHDLVLLGLFTGVTKPNISAKSGKKT